MQPGKRRLRRIVSLLIGLMNSASSRVAEGVAEYQIAPDLDEEPDPTP